MRTLEFYLTGVFGLIFVYLLVSNASSANTILKGLSSANVDMIRALQVR